MERVAILVAPFCVQAHTEWVSNLARESRKSCYLPFPLRVVHFHTLMTGPLEMVVILMARFCVRAHTEWFSDLFQKTNRKFAI